MKKRITALLLMLAIFVIPAAAASTYRKQIAVDYGITLNINGQQAVLKDPNGNTVQPFVYNGTTYVPIRAVSDNLGATVGYNSLTNTATVNASVNSDQAFLDYVYYLYTVEKSSRIISSNVDYYASLIIEGNKINISGAITSSENALNDVYAALSKLNYTQYASKADTLYQSYMTLSGYDLECIDAYQSSNYTSFSNSYGKFNTQFSATANLINNEFKNTCKQSYN